MELYIRVEWIFLFASFERQRFARGGSGLSSGRALCMKRSIILDVRWPGQEASRQYLDSA